MAAAGGEQEQEPARFVYVTRFGSHQCGSVLQLGGRRAKGRWSLGLRAGCGQEEPRGAAAGAAGGGGERPPGSAPAASSPAASSPAPASSARSGPRPAARAGGAKGSGGRGWAGCRLLRPASSSAVALPAEPQGLSAPGSPAARGPPWPAASSARPGLGSARRCPAGGSAAVGGQASPSRPPTSPRWGQTSSVIGFSCAPERAPECT